MTKHTTDYLDEIQVRSRFVKMGREYKKGRDIILPEEGLLTDRNVCALAGEAFCQGMYHFDKHELKGWKEEDQFYRREELSSFYEDEIPNVIGTSQQIEDFYNGFSLGKCIGYARTLGNLPSNFLNTKDMVDYIQLMARETGLELKLLKESQLKKLSCNGIAAANKGSNNEAVVAILKYCSDDSIPLTALIGKEVILESMEFLKRSKKKCNVIAVLPLVENAIGPDTLRPGDVVETMSGKTVEISNTEAEGRLVLCDAITIAVKYGAKRIIDLTSLTSSCREALGDFVTGVFCNDDETYEAFSQAAKEAGELIWRLPLLPPYRELVKKSNVADLVNFAPSMGADASFAACFLEEFIPKDVTWLHIDCAGTAILKEEQDGVEVGATGAMASTLVHFLNK